LGHTASLPEHGAEGEGFAHPAEEASLPGTSEGRSLHSAVYLSSVKLQRCCFPVTLQPGTGENMGALPKAEQVFTYADYKDWELGEGERFEIICGEAFAMSAPDARHQAILTELLSQFHVYLRGKQCKVYPAPYDVRLFYKEDGSDNTVVQPDISVICDEMKRGTEGCRGAPDLVVEILSASNSAIEMDRKFKLYQQAGVREYWIVDPKNNELTVFCFGEKPGFKFYKSTDTVSVTVLSGLNITLEQVFSE
jgi:Uma2 family endonuclease